MAVKIGDFVRLYTPDNPYLDGEKAQVAELTEWGAHVHTEVGSRKFRALSREMIPYAQVNGPTRAMLQARESGYTGNLCPSCGGCRMVRSGACEKCEDCGSSSGCS
jgi:hypothetical protein